MAKYPYIVIHNGKWYQSGEEVPEIHTAENKEPLPFSDDSTAFGIQEDKVYTKTDINNMKTADLQELAAKQGIENAYDTSGSKLKKILVEHFGL